MSKVNLAITGCLGRMGQQLIKSANKDKSIKLVALTENRTIDKKIYGIKPGLNTEEAFKNTNFQSLSKTPKRDEGSGRPTKKDRREIDEYHENQKTK